MAELTTLQLQEIAGTQKTRAASDVKANWREIVKEARSGDVIVTSYNKPEAVVISAERYVKMKAAAEANDPLAELMAQFDRELAVLNAAGAADKLREIFHATPEEMAAAATAAARKNK